MQAQSCWSIAIGTAVSGAKEHESVLQPMPDDSTMMDQCLAHIIKRASSKTAMLLVLCP